VFVMVIGGGGVVMVPAVWRGVGRVGEEEMGKMGKETGNGGAMGLGSLREVGG
jgi:hypothetical protein